MERNHQLFARVLNKICEGMTITFTENTIAEGDSFLILGCGYDKCEVSFHCHGGLWWVYFDNDEPMLLEDVPDSFLRSILKNI